MKNELVVETAIEVDASPAQVWRALTTPKLIKKYLMGTEVTSAWEEGSAITYTGEYNGKKYHDKGMVKKMVPEKILQTTYWSSMAGKEDRPENYKLITYTISRYDGKTLITLTQDNNDSENEKQHATENWKKVLEKLKEVVETSRN